MDTTSTTSEYLTMFPQLASMLYEWMRGDGKILFGSDANAGLADQLQNVWQMFLLEPPFNNAVNFFQPVFHMRSPFRSFSLWFSPPASEAMCRRPHGHPFGIDPVMVAKHENVYMDTTSTTSEYLTMFPQLANALACSGNAGLADQLQNVWQMFLLFGTA